MTRGTTRQDLKAPNTSSPHRCGHPSTRRRCGEGCAPAISQSYRRTTARSASPIRKLLARTISPKIPNGGPGIENRLSLIYNAGVHGGRINDNQFVNLIATQPAKIFGLFPRKGTIAIGSDGDLVIFDPNRELEISASTHLMNIDYNMYEGMRVRGSADEVLLRGKPIVRERKYVGQPGDGQYIPRQRFSL